MNKILVKIYMPLIDEKYDIWIPINKTVYNIILLLSQMSPEFNLNNLSYTPLLYNKYSGFCYNIKSVISDTDIKNGTELILI